MPENDVIYEDDPMVKIARGALHSALFSLLYTYHETQRRERERLIDLNESGIPRVREVVKRPVVFESGQRWRKGDTTYVLQALGRAPSPYPEGVFGLERGQDPRDHGWTIAP